MKGGRYDNLLGYFGKQAPAIGFAVVIDDLLSAIERQNGGIVVQDASLVLSYNEDNYEEKLKEAQKERRAGKKVTLVPENKWI